MLEITNRIALEEFLFEKLFKESKEKVSQIKPKTSLFFIPFEIDESDMCITKHSLDIIEFGIVVFMFLTISILTSKITSWYPWYIIGFFIAIIFLFLAIYVGHKTVKASDHIKILKLYNDYEKITNEFYESMLFIYNYKEDDLCDLIDKLQEIEYSNKTQQEFSNIIIKIKRNQPNINLTESSLNYKMTDRFKL